MKKRMGRNNRLIGEGKKMEVEHKPVSCELLKVEGKEQAIRFLCDKHEPQIECTVVLREIKTKIERYKKRPAIVKRTVMMIRCPECKLYREGVLNDADDLAN